MPKPPGPKSGHRDGRQGKPAHGSASDTGRDRPKAGGGRDRPLAGAERDRPRAGTERDRPRAGTERDRPRAGTEEKLVRICGLPAVRAQFETDADAVERLFFTEEMKRQTGDFCTLLAGRRKPFRLVGPEEMARVAGTVLHGGVAAVTAARPVPPLDLAEVAAWAGAGRPLFILDGISNPHNLGAIARTAAFFGLERLVLSDHPAQALPSDAAYRIAEGGLHHLRLFRAAGLGGVLRRLAEHYLVVGTALGAGSGAAVLSRLPAGPKPVAVILGNEENGLGPATLGACEARLTIPGSGLVQSLNVAATAAILMHELAASSNPFRAAPLPSGKGRAGVRRPA
jgi:RNA methyltransferase, TrmH family